MVLEGEAVRVTDGPTLERLAARCRYRFTFHTAIGNATAEPHGATRWRFEH